MKEFENTSSTPNIPALQQSMIDSMSAHLYQTYFDGHCSVQELEIYKHGFQIVSGQDFSNSSDKEKIRIYLCSLVSPLSQENLQAINEFAVNELKLSTNDIIALAVLTGKLSVLELHENVKDSKTINGMRLLAVDAMDTFKKMINTLLAFNEGRQILRDSFHKKDKQGSNWLHLIADSYSEVFFTVIDTILEDSSKSTLLAHALLEKQDEDQRSVFVVIRQVDSAIFPKLITLFASLKTDDHALTQSVCLSISRKDWTLLHMMARYAPEGLPQIINLLNETDTGKEVLAKSLCMQTKQGTSGLHLIAQYAPHCLPAIINVLEQSESGKHALTKSLSLQDEHFFSGLSRILEYCPQHLILFKDYINHTDVLEYSDVVFSQIHLNRKLNQYIAHHTQENNIQLFGLLDRTGRCFGYSIVFSSMRFLGYSDWWKCMLANIAAWDGSADGLEHELKAFRDENGVLIPAPLINEQKAKLKRAFELVVNYVFIYQYPELLQIAEQKYQNHVFFRKNGLEMAQKEGGICLTSAIKLAFNITTDVGKAHLADFLHDNRHTLVDYIIEIGGKNHGTSLGFEQGAWVFYDSNFRHYVKRFASSAELVNQIITSHFESKEIVLTFGAVKKSIRSIQFYHFIKHLIFDYKHSSSHLVLDNGLAFQSTENIYELVNVFAGEPKLSDLERLDLLKMTIAECLDTDSVDELFKWVPQDKLLDVIRFENKSRKTILTQDIKPQRIKTILSLISDPFKLFFILLLVIHKKNDLLPEEYSDYKGKDALDIAIELPQPLLLEAISLKDSGYQTLLMKAGKRPEVLKIFLESIPSNQRLSTITKGKRNWIGNFSLLNDVVTTKSSNIILDALPDDDKLPFINLLLLYNRKCSIPDEYAHYKQKKWIDILDELPQSKQREILSDLEFFDRIFDEIEINPESLQKILDLINLEQRFEKMKSLISGKFDFWHKVTADRKSINVIFDLMPDDKKMFIIFVMHMQDKSSYLTDDYSQYAHQNITDIFQKIPVEQRLDALKVENQEGETILRRVVSTPESLERILDCIPPEAHFKVINSDIKTVRKVTSSPQSLKIILKSLTSKERLEILLANTLLSSLYNKSQRPLYEAALYPASLNIILELLASEQRLEAAKSPGLLYHVASNPESLKMLLELLPLDDRLKAVTESDTYRKSVLSKAALNPFALCETLKLLPAEQRITALNKLYEQGIHYLHGVVNCIDELKNILSMLPISDRNDIFKIQDAKGVTLKDAVYAEDADLLRDLASSLNIDIDIDPPDRENHLKM